jgi:hypothetical protein
MAEVKMSLDELRAMEKTEKLLEVALENEKKWAEEIKQLQKEKISALENNEKVVTTVLIKRTAQTAYSLHSGDELLRRMESVINYDRARRGPSRDSHQVGEYMKTLFEYKDHEFETHREVSTKGLDQITAEIREQLQSKLDTEVQEKLERLKKISKEKDKVYEELQEAKRVSDIYQKELIVSRENYEISIEENKEFVKENVRLTKAYKKFSDVLFKENSPWYMSANKFKDNLTKELTKILKKQQDDAN